MIITRCPLVAYSMTYSLKFASNTSTWCQSTRSVNVSIAELLRNEELNELISCRLKLVLVSYLWLLCVATLNETAGNASLPRCLGSWPTRPSSLTLFMPENENAWKTLTSILHSMVNGLSLYVPFSWYVRCSAKARLGVCWRLLNPLNIFALRISLNILFWLTLIPAFVQQKKNQNKKHRWCEATDSDMWWKWHLLWWRPRFILVNPVVMSMRWWWNGSLLLSHIAPFADEVIDDDYFDFISICEFTSIHASNSNFKMVWRGFQETLNDQNSQFDLQWYSQLIEIINQELSKQFFYDLTVLTLSFAITRHRRCSYGPSTQSRESTIHGPARDFRD